jgi:hypothetical protein
MHPTVFTKAVANYTNLSAKAGTGSITLESGVTETWAKIRKAADFNKKG